MRFRKVACAALLLAAAPASAEQFVEQDGFRVHYAALPSTEIAAETARAFGIERSRKHALLVLNAQRIAGDAALPVAAAASGTARNLIGHVQKLALRPVREGAVHYVIAEVDILNQEWLTFELFVSPDGSASRIPLKFRQQFYTD